MSGTPQLLKRYFSTPCKTYLEPTHSAPSLTSITTQEILSRGRQYLLPVYARPDFVLSYGKGAWVWDVDGRKFLDFNAGIAVNALGHADEGVLKASLCLISFILFRWLWTGVGIAMLVVPFIIGTPTFWLLVLVISLSPGYISIQPLGGFVPTFGNHFFYSHLHLGNNYLRNEMYF